MTDPIATQKNNLQQNWFHIIPDFCFVSQKTLLIHLYVLLFIHMSMTVP